MRHIPRGFLELRIEDVERSRERPIVIYCAGGVRSAFAAKSLESMGYRQVTSMSGGFNGWKNAGLPWKVERQLSQEQKIRYSRHILLPEIGEAGQKKLLDAKILLVGAGGLGSPAAFYLAAAGIGKIGIVDPDVVDHSNLQRQILHRIQDVSAPKVDSAERAMRDLNPDIDVKYRELLTSENILRIRRWLGVVVDGCDNTGALPHQRCLHIPKSAECSRIDLSIRRADDRVRAGARRPVLSLPVSEPPPPGLAPGCSRRASSARFPHRRNA